MLLLLSLIATLVLFEFDIAARYAGKTDTALFQILFALVVLVNVTLLPPVSRFLARLGSFGKTIPSARPNPVAGWLVFAATLIVGLALLIRSAFMLADRIFTDPIDEASGNAPLAILRMAINRLAEGKLIYEFPYDLGGWTTTLQYMPGLVWLQVIMRSLSLDGRFLGLLAVVAVGAIALTAAMLFVHQWRRGEAGGRAIGMAVLLLIVVGLWSNGLATRTFALREPVAIVWLLMALFALAVGARTWVLAAGFLAMTCAGSIAMIFLAPVLFVGIYFMDRARISDTSCSAVPNIPMVVFLLILMGALLPHWVELGKLSEGVVQEPLKAEAFYAVQGQLGLFPGAAWLLHTAGIGPLMPIVFLILCGEIINQSRRMAAGDVSRLLRLLALAVFLVCVFSPRPSNLMYWNFLPLLLVAGIREGFEGLTPSALPAPSAPPCLCSARLPILSTFLLVAVVLGLTAVHVKGISDFSLAKRAANPAWKGHDLARDGFHPREGDQIWMNGTRAVIAIPTTRKKSGTIRLALSVVGSNTHLTNTITVDFNGRTACSAELKTGGFGYVDVPVYADEWMIGANTLVLRAQWADSPVNMGLEGNDQRILSFGFYGLEWKPTFRKKK